MSYGCQINLALSNNNTDNNERREAYNAKMCAIWMAVCWDHQSCTALTRSLPIRSISALKDFTSKITILRFYACLSNWSINTLNVLKNVMKYLYIQTNRKNTWTRSSTNPIFSIHLIFSTYSSTIIVGRIYPM